MVYVKFTVILLARQRRDITRHYHFITVSIYNILSIITVLNHSIFAEWFNKMVIHLAALYYFYEC